MLSFFFMEIFSLMFLFQNGNHYHVSLLQSDGDYNLERGTNRGDGTDLWHSSSTHTYLGQSTTSEGPYPNTDSYQGGEVVKVGHLIHDISESSSIMSFKLSLYHGDKNLPPPRGKTTQAPRPKPLESPHPPTPPPTSFALSQVLTTLEGGNGSYGAMFDIRASSKKRVMVHTLDIHTRSKVEGLDVEVYTRPGTHISHETNSAGWTMVCKTTVTGRGYMLRTPIQTKDFTPVTIENGDRQAFYVTMTLPDIRYTNGEEGAFGTPHHSSNQDMKVLIGTGIGGYPFSSDYYPNRIFNGAVMYTVEDIGGGNALGSSDGTVTGRDPPEPQTFILSTTYAADNGSFGSMFVATALEDIVIIGMDIHTKATGSVPVEVFTKTGTYQGYEDDPNAWDPVVSIPELSAKGLGVPTALSFDGSVSSSHASSVTIATGESRSFYVTMRSGDLRYTNGVHPASNDHLLIGSQSAGVGGYPFGPVYDPRAFNGSLKYRLSRAGGPFSGNIPLSVKINPKKLTTTYKNGNGSFGSMFDVVAISNLMIESVDMHIRTTDLIHIRVYTKQGTHINLEKDAVAWGNPIVDMSMHVKGSGNPTPIPTDAFEAVRVYAGSTQAFYVTLNKAELRYSNGVSNNDVTASNDDLMITRGTGVGGIEFSKNARLFSPRTWNGSVLYHILPSKVSSLTTTFQGGNGSYGTIFDVVTQRDIVMLSLDIHVDSEDTVTVQVWTKHGSYDGNLGGTADWTQVVKDAVVRGAGRDHPTAIPPLAFTEVNIQEGETQAFYVTLLTPSLRYTNMQSRGNDGKHSNDDIVVLPGLGVGGFPLDKARTYSSRIFNGALHYE